MALEIIEVKMGNKGPLNQSSGKAGVKLPVNKNSSEFIRKVSDLVYAMWLKDMHIENERRRYSTCIPGSKTWDRSGG